MSKFTEEKGEFWRIEFDCFLLDRIEKETGVDLADMSAAGLFAIEKVTTLCRVLVIACEEQRKERNQTPEQFQKHLRGDVITRARGAVMEALADFFPASEWSAMQSNLQTLRKTPKMTPEQMQLAMEFLRMDPETKKTVLTLVEKEMGGGNSESSPGGESASDLAAILPTNADSSLGSVTLAQEGSPSETSG